MKNNIKKFITRLFLIIITLLLAISILIVFNILNKDTFYEGIKINGIDVSGLNREETLNLIKKRLRNNIRDKKIKLNYENNYYYINYEDIDVVYDYYEAIDKCYKIGRTGNLIDRLKDINKAKKQGFNYKMSLEHDKSKLFLEITKVYKYINVEPENATLKILNGKYEISTEKIGRKVNENKLEKNIEYAIRNNINSINIPVEIVKPAMTVKILEKINYKISRFSTTFNSYDYNRVNNIKLATNVINGKIILSGEIFSFNKATGVRSIEKGYKISKVINNGRYVPDIGGGVCQVSTTLYNAILYSDMEIIERHHHTIPSNYIVKGRDSAVSYDYLDLKFKNDTEYPMYIEGKIINNMIVINIYSNRDLISNNTVIETKIVEVVQPEIKVIVDKALQKGQEIIIQKSRIGYKVETYKVKYNSNVEVDRVLISDDYYKPQNLIIKVGS